MKSKLFLAISMTLLFCISGFAQQDQQGRVRNNNPVRLTEEQKAKMKEIRLATFKEISPLKNQLGELKAKQKSLTMAEKPDMSAINNNIDEMAKVQARISKIRTAAQVQVRSILTDEQKMFFDSKNFGNFRKDMKQNRGKLMQHRFQQRQRVNG